MISKLLIFNKVKRSNDSIREQHKKNLAILDENRPFYKEAYEGLSQQIQTMEKEMTERENKLKQLCDIGDIMLYSIITQIILMAVGFAVGVIIAEIISVIALFYAYKLLGNKKGFVYLPVAMFCMFSIIISISCLFV